MELQVTRGVLGLVGEAIDTIANKSLNNQSLGHTNEPTLTRLGHHHITLISKEELEAMDKAKWANSTVDTERLYPLGLGGGAKDASLFVVVVWAAGQQFRRQLGLPPMHFHITLSDRPHDDFVTDKSIDSLLPGQFPSSPSPELLDHIIFTLIAFNEFDKASLFCVQLIQATLDSYRGFLRYADVTYRIGKYKLSMLAYACAFQRTDDDKVRKYCIKRIVQCSAYTEWGGLLTHDESLHIPGDIFHSIIAPWTDDLRYCLNEMIIKPTLCLDSRERLYLPNGQTKTIFQKLPRFFRWLIPFYLAIMSTPRNESDISMLASPHLSIRRILTLTEEEPLPKAWFSGKNIKHTYLPIPNYHPPSIEQMDLVMRLFEEEDSSPMLIHCGGGKGRAGTIAACYLVAYGFGKPCGNLTQPTMSASDAIGALRAIRPGSIETPQQEAFVSKWSSTIWKRRCVVPPLVIEPAACSLAVEGEFLPDSADLFVLVGLPGSGKSYFSRALMARCGRGWAYVSQDESGSRAFSETQLGRASGRVILDRCNTSFHDRRTWLKLASWSVSPVCILFDYDADLCISRAQNRANHPTLPPGSRVRNAVDQMKREFVQPTLAEGFKAIVTVRSFAASHELVMLISPPVLLFKYPRTPHLLDLGAATDDDIISNTNLPDGVNGHIVITEKVDGANMGISLSADRQILVQNRAHYVNTSTHEQFKKLGIWLDRHREDVYKILHRDELYPERFILFGEWMSAIHSIEYTNLPDRFLAFDFFDRRTEAFADRNSLSRILSSTSIQMVPVILEGRMPGDDELRNMIQKQSSYCEGRMEGVYLKLERDGRVVTRGKIVRGDFIPGNEHWTRGHLRTNGIKADDF